MAAEDILFAKTSLNGGFSQKEKKKKGLYLEREVGGKVGGVGRERTFLNSK